MLASYSGKAHNYQKLAVCTACTRTSIRIRIRGHPVCILIFIFYYYSIFIWTYNLMSVGVCMRCSKP